MRKFVNAGGAALFGYMLPRILVAAGVPLDHWAKNIGHFLSGVSISLDASLSLLGIFIAVVLVTVELWWQPVARLWNFIPSSYIPLEKAARLAYNAAQDSAAAAIAESDLRSDDPNPLKWFAHALKGGWKDGGLALYGYKPHITKIKPITHEEYTGGDFNFTDDGVNLVARSNNRILYEHLQVKRSALKRRVGEIKTWG